MTYCLWQIPYKTSRPISLDSMDTASKKAGYPRPAISIEAVDQYLSKREKPFCLIIASEYPHGPYFKESKFDPEDVLLPPFQADNKWNRNYFGRYYTSIEEKKMSLKQFFI